MLMMCATAVAQQHDANVMNVTVPFSFVVNGTTLPAGTYEFRLSPEWVTITTGSGEFKLHVISGTRTVEETKEAHVVFQDRNGIKYLVEIHHGNGTLRSLPMPESHAKPATRVR
jgi:hypothetical protein